LIWNLVGVLISLGAVIKVVEKISLSRLQHEPVSTAVVCLFFLIPAAWFTWGTKFGVRVSSAGVKSVSPSRISFTPWDEIARFVVAETRPTMIVRVLGGSRRGVCIWAEHADGGRTQLDALTLRPAWATALDRYCAALNGELAAWRGTGASIHSLTREGCVY
jgi:hypothetical protein